MVAPVYQGSGVKLVGDGSSHHYKDPTRRGERSKRWLHRYIKDLGLNPWEMGVLTITRIPTKGGKKEEFFAPVYQGSGIKWSLTRDF
jgi:hypothetical protein